MKRSASPNRIATVWVTVVVAVLAGLGLRQRSAGGFPFKVFAARDALRVRATPERAGRYVGVLYRNMRVQVLDRTVAKESLDGMRDRWYRVRWDQGTGWVFGGYLEFALLHGGRDTYTYGATGDLRWFYERFGSSTWGWGEKLAGQSFSVEEARNVMAAALQGDRNANAALCVTLYAALRDSPGDPGLAYFKRRLYDRAFICRLVTGAGPEVLEYLPNSWWRRDMPPEDLCTLKTAAGWNVLKRLPAQWWSRDRVAGLLTGGPCPNAAWFRWAPESLRTDVGLARAALAAPEASNTWDTWPIPDRDLAAALVRLNPLNFKVLSPELRDDPEIVGVAINRYPCMIRDAGPVQRAAHPEAEEACQESITKEETRQREMQREYSE